MKRIIALCVMGCALTVAVFAQFNVGGYAKSYWVPYRLTVPGGTGDDLAGGVNEVQHTTAVQAPWGEPALSAGLNFDGYSEWGGIHLGVGVDSGAADAFSATGGGWVWVKPFNFIKGLGMDTFTLWAGGPSDSTLTGKVRSSDLVSYVLNDGYYHHGFRIEYREGHQNIFTSINPYGWGNRPNNTEGKQGNENLYWPLIYSGAMITWTPIKNLFIGAWVAPEQSWITAWAAAGGLDITTSANGPKLGEQGIDQDYYSVDEVYRKMQIAAGYTMPGIGFARLQWVGARNTLEAAFQVLSLPDIVLDIGVKIPFEGTDKYYDGTNDTIDSYKRKNDYQASIAAQYRYADFRLMARVDTAFGGSDSSVKGARIKERGLDMIVYVVPQYSLGVGTIGLDLGFEYEQADDFTLNGSGTAESEIDGMKAGAGLWFHRDLGNAKFKIAAVARMPLAWHSDVNEPFELFFPIILEAGF